MVGSARIRREHGHLADYMRWVEGCAISMHTDSSQAILGFIDEASIISEEKRSCDAIKTVTCSHA